MGMIDRRAFWGMTLAAMATPALAAPRDRVVPLRLEDNVLTTPVTLNGKGPYPFLVASGSLFAIVSQDLARELGLEARATGADLYTVSGRVPFQLYKADTFNLGGVWPMRNVELIGRPIHSTAVFGAFPFLSIQMSSFDFDARELRVHRLRVAPPDGATKHAIIQREGIRAIREEPRIRAQYGGKTLRLLVNTGRSESLVLYPDTVKRLDLWDRYARAQSDVDDDSDGRSAEIRRVIGDPLEIGGYRFERPLVTLMSPQGARADQIDEDGVVGMEVLRRFKITFDPVKQNVWFLANSHAGEPFQS